ncbi:putative galacturonosyltransferase 7 [Nymphaea thermarum]|nr:putative galacturonosyltransferase 7 [Nymphaea thermarum]
MKGSSVSAKKGAWNKFTTAVMGLVVLSLLVPLIFSLGGLHNRAGYSGFGSDEGETALNDVKTTFIEENSTHPTKVDMKVSMKPERTSWSNDAQRPSDKFEKSMQHSHSDRILQNELKDNDEGETDLQKPADNDETDKSCEDAFGSYCLWRKKHKKVMEDSMVKKLKDRLFMARSYYPSIAKKNQTHEKLTRELKQNIQEFERVLSDATTDADLQGSIGQKLQNMEVAIAKAEAEHVGCYHVDRKLAQILDMTKDEALFHRRQSAFLYNLGVQTIPKSHHCLSMRLTVEYFKSLPDHGVPSEIDHSDASGLQHYVIFSKNVLASSVVINSTSTYAKGSTKMVFHLLTDSENYFAMKHWFIRNSYNSATVHVENIDEHKQKYVSAGLNNILHLSASEEFRVTIGNGEDALLSPKRTEYLSVFSEAYFCLPQIFSKLKKVIVLDDDVVVQRDLLPLWNLDLEGKVIGAPEFCSVRLGHLNGYLNAGTLDLDACIWMSGLNIIDLEKWRELNLLQQYQERLQRIKDGSLPQARALSASLVTFNGLIYGLDNSWVLSGLGHQYGIDRDTIKRVAVLHYNGKMKPWLELGIRQYKGYWTRFLKRDDQYMDDCNVNR